MSSVPEHQDIFNPRCEIFKDFFTHKPLNRDLCIQCKSNKLLCGRPKCPLIEQVEIHSQVEPLLKRNLSSLTPPGFFVGWKGYPKVSLGPMGILGDFYQASFLDDPGRWYGSSIQDVVNYRSVLVRSHQSLDIHEAADPKRQLQMFQEMVLSPDPVDVDIQFKKKPKFSMAFSPIAQPMGPTAELQSFDLTGNYSVPRATDKVVSDGDLRAVEGAYSLYKKGCDVYYIAKLFSAGLLGRDKHRKLVPTRWSITAVDDIIAKKMVSEITMFSQLGEYRVYSNEYIGNHYEILLIPGPYEYEQLEVWCAGSIWGPSQGTKVISEYESADGRSSYAIQQGGGYYASRLPVLEKLVDLKRQATVVAFREIYEDYYLPVGVWEVRENVRHALMDKDKKFQSFSSLQEALAHIDTQLRTPATEWIRKSVVLKKKLFQKTLADF